MTGEFEPRLEKDDPEKFFVSEFRKRLTVFKGLDEGNGWCWVIPFHYYEDPDEFDGLRGGLWIPDLETQDLVSRVGTYIHYRLDADLDHGKRNTGLHIPGPYIRGVLDYSGEVAVVCAPDSMVCLVDSLREQVEATYGVQLEERST